MENLIKQTKVYKFSTQSSSGGTCLNIDPNFKSFFEYQIPVVNLHEEDIEYIYLSVPHCIFPVSFYNIDYQNNQLDVLVGTIITSYTFVPGNYNAITFQNQFLSLLGTGWSISLDPVSNQFSIINTTTPFSILSSSTISSVLGFSSTLTSSVIALGNNTVVFPRTCNFLSTPRLHLRCKELCNSSTSCIVSKNCNSDILVSIPNDSAVNGRIVYRNSSYMQSLLDIPFIQKLTFRITDENDNLINFNGISSYFELQLDIYRKKIQKRLTFRQVVRELSQILE